MSDRSAGLAPSRVTAILGPTNTGKTHLAVERMLGHASGMIGLPLRLLAREIYERIVKQRGAASVALITGEEKIIPPRPAFFVCTVEAMPLERQVEFLAVDEIQLVADPERGHVFTQRLLHARGRFETMFLGAGTMAPLIRNLVPDVEIISRERLSTLSYAGSKKLTRLPRRSAVVAFSTEQVYAIAELLRRQRGGAAVVMGSLSPRTRNAQVELFQSGEVDFLVATDAIGMGLNMDVDHVAFAGLRKFDGRRTRWLHAPEVAQIAGRAGRHLRDGTFGVTGEAQELDEDLVEQVVEHRFDPIEGAEWRNSRLDFDTLPDLLRSLTLTPDRHGLRLTAQALDETLLRRFANDDDIKRIAKSRGSLMRLWETCQLPDFQKTTLDEHARLAKDIFHALTSRRGRLLEDWIAPRFNDLDRHDGQIDQLSARLAGVRTLSYIANRPDWMDQAQYWRDRTKVLEERLSDVLHERLTARFVDRRTTALMRALNVSSDTLAGVDDAGHVTVEGEIVGRLQGVMFTPDTGGSALAERALRQAATRAVAPEIGRRLKVLAKTEDTGFTLEADGTVLWQGALAARLSNEDLFHPRVTLLGTLGDTGSREAAQKRIETWLTQEAGSGLRDLKRLKRAVDDGVLKGLVRGIAWRLVEAGGVLPRSEVQADLSVLPPEDRRALAKFAVRIGTHAVWLPSVVKPRAMRVARAFVAREAEPVLKGEGLLPAPRTQPDLRVLAAFGRQVVGRYTVPVEMLEDYAEQQRKAGRGDLSAEALAALGWTESEVRSIRSALRPPRRDDSRTATATPTLPQMDEDSPFAALMALKTAEVEAPKPPKRDKKKRKPKAKPSPDTTDGETSAEGETTDITAADAPVLDGDAADTPVRKRRRRRRGKGGKADASGLEISSTEDAETEQDVAQQTQDETGDAQKPDASTEPARKRRRRRKPKPKSDTEAGSQTEAEAGANTTAAVDTKPGPELSVDTAHGTAAPDDETASEAAEGEPARKKRRRRRGRKPGVASLEGEAQTASDATTTTQAHHDAPSTTAPEASSQQMPSPEAETQTTASSEPSAPTPPASSSDAAKQDPTPKA